MSGSEKPTPSGSAPGASATGYPAGSSMGSADGSYAQRKLDRANQRARLSYLAGLKIETLPDVSLSYHARECQTIMSIWADS